MTGERDRRSQDRSGGEHPEGGRHTGDQLQLIAAWTWDPRSDRIEPETGADSLSVLTSGPVDGTLGSLLRGVHCDDRSFVEDSLCRAGLDRSSFAIEFRVDEPGGPARWIALEGEFPAGGSGDGPATCLAHDVTARRVAEEKLERLAAIIESSDDAIVSKDLTGIITSWNGAAERIFGYPANEIIGKSKALVIPPDQPNELESILSRIRRGEKIERYETVRIRKDGKRIPVSVTVSPINDASGRIIGASTIARDITERRHSEVALRLEREHVDALNERLRRSMKETHHRVRNNLQLIAALVDMQSDDVEVNPREVLRRIGGQVRALAAVHEILTAEAEGSDKANYVPAREMFDRLALLLHDATPDRSIRAESEDIHLSARQCSSLAIIANELVTNAVKQGAHAVEMLLSTEGPSARLVVLDDGPGFPPGFALEDNKRTGLPLVRQIAQWDLHGSLTVSNRIAGGGSVDIAFPLATDSVDA